MTDKQMEHCGKINKKKSRLSANKKGVRGYAEMNDMQHWSENKAA